jgi:6-phosphogluconolactonase
VHGALCHARFARRVFFSTTPDRSDTLKAVSTTMQSPDVAASEPVVKRYPDMDTLSRQVAADIAARLTHAIATRGLASLVVSGGRSPVKLFEQLRTQTIEWSRVCVALADERWVAPTDADSNEKLVREALLQGKAAAARFLGLKNAAPSPDLGAVSAWETFARIPRPFDVTLLGMGDDGHTASLFPGSPNLRSALNPAAAAGCVGMWAPSAPQPRLSLNVSALLDSRHILILIAGESKLRAYLAAGAAGPMEDMPVRAVLRQQRAPVEVIWAP